MQSVQNKTILAIAPHVDDVEIGVGGTIYQLSSKNEVHYLGLSLPPRVHKGSFMQEFWNSADYLGIRKESVEIHDYDPRDLFASRNEIRQLFYEKNQLLEPDMVFIPNSQDLHQSHQTVYQEAVRVFKNTTMLGYEMPWNSLEFKGNVFIEISEQAFKQKLKSIDCFASQRERSFFDNDILSDLGRLRGKQIGKRYCECFEAIRIVN